MSASATALRPRPARPRPALPRPLPRRVPVAGRRPRPATRRLAGVEARRRVRRVRRMLWCCGTLIVCSLIAAVAFHVVLAQSQLQIERLNRETIVEQHRYEQLRLEVARLASPERVVARARELGLVLPAEPSKIVTVPTDPGSPAAASPDSTATTLAESWPKVKPHLAARP
jgi:cell division protein FtsL